MNMYAAMQKQVHQLHTLQCNISSIKKTLLTVKYRYSITCNILVSCVYHLKISFLGNSHALSTSDFVEVESSFCIKQVTWPWAAKDLFLLHIPLSWHTCTCLNLVPQTKNNCKARNGQIKDCKKENQLVTWTIICILTLLKSYHLHVLTEK